LRGADAPLGDALLPDKGLGRLLKPGYTPHSYLSHKGREGNDLDPDLRRDGNYKGGVMDCFATLAMTRISTSNLKIEWQQVKL